MGPAAARDDELVPGVREVEHTADVGIEVEAASLVELFRRAASGMMALIAGEKAAWPPVPASECDTELERVVKLERGDVESLLVHWLRELLYLLEVKGFAYRDAEFAQLDESSLDATVRGTGSAPPQICELKGVTYHELGVEHVDGTWRARVIFDI